MPWTLLDSRAPFFRWQARLTAAQPDAGLHTIAQVQTPTLQVEGVFGTGVVELRGSNSGGATVPLDVLRIADVVAVLPVYTVGVRVLDADETTDLLVTLAGRR